MEAINCLPKNTATDGRRELAGRRGTELGTGIATHPAANCGKQLQARRRCAQRSRAYGSTRTRKKVT